VAVIQLVGLLAIATVGHLAPYWVCAIYLVLLGIVGICAALFMDNLDHGIEVDTMRSILSVPDTWVISLLYICTFGSWIGFSFAFGQVLQVNFASTGQSQAQASLHTTQIAFIGPALGSLSRIYGGRLADRVGGSRITLATFAGMIGAAGLLVAVSAHNDHTPGPITSTTMVCYVTGFMALFILSGMGSGSVFKLIPSIFEARSHALAVSFEMSETQRRHWSRAMSGSLIGFVAAVGALGGVGINLVLRQSYQSTGSQTSALWIFLVAYATASVLTWAMYVRRPVSAAAIAGTQTASAPARL
jgi:NNP family nitrate/nitrite transporter-like MFS transporter